MKYFMCKDCTHCKTKNGKISCKNGHFENLTYKEMCLFTPYDFDCYEWEES